MSYKPRQNQLLQLIGVDIYKQKKSITTASNSEAKPVDRVASLGFKGVETQSHIGSVAHTESQSPDTVKKNTIANIKGDATEPAQSTSDITHTNYTDLPSLEQAVSRCQACRLSATRTQTVFGVGNEHADWLFIGEAPGLQEDTQGEPFVGKAGQLLDAMLAALDLSRSQVYIANTVKCHPPENREPEADELAHCRHFLQTQIDLIQPKVIVALGKVSASWLTGSDDTLSNLRTKVHVYGNNIPLFVTFHPAYLLRRPIDKALAWQDLCRARSLLNKS